MAAGTSAVAADPEIFSSSEGSSPIVAGKIAYVRIVEPDVDKAVDFWTKGVGMKKTTRPNGEPGEVVLQFGEDVTQKSSAIGLIVVKGGTSKGRGLFFKEKQVPKVQYQDGKKFAKIVYAVSDIPRVVKRAQVRNMVVTDATDKHAYMLEPNRGNMIELIPLSDLPDTPTKFTLQRITFVKLITTDFHQIGDFLGNVLNMTETGNVELTKKLTAMGYPQPARSIRPNIRTPGGTLVDVSHAYKEDVK